MRKGKKLLLFVILMVLVLMPVNAQAASKKSKAVKAYQNYMAQQESGSKFALIYLDNNAVPELIYAKPNQSIYKIFTWKGGKMKTVYSCDYSEAPSDGHTISHYYKKKGVFVSKPYSGAVGFSGRMYFQFNGKKYKNTLYKSIWFGSTDYMKVKNSKFTKITSAQFNKLLKNAVGSKKMTKIKYYSNTAANRGKYLK